MEFARSRGWLLRDGMIYFPDAAAAATTDNAEDEDSSAAGVKEGMSKLVIENALGYARELETIV